MASMANVFDYGLNVSEFKLQLSYNVHFYTNTLKKGYEPPYLH